MLDRQCASLPQAWYAGQKFQEQRGYTRDSGQNKNIQTSWLR